jgi:hypothetical protein
VVPFIILLWNLGTTAMSSGREQKQRREEPSVRSCSLFLQSKDQKGIFG